jgi:Tol biopolymer transport system component
MKKFVMLALLANCLLTAYAQNAGDFENHEDIGNPKNKGNAVYNNNLQEYTLWGSGINMWGSADQFQFLWRKIKGDFIITATIHFIGNGTEPHRKIGIIARENLTPGSRYADACVHGSGLTSLQFRDTAEGSTGEVALTSNNPVNIELQRTGNVFTFSAATPGENYKSASKEISLNDEVYAGLFICAHNADVTEEAVFSNVRIIIPAAKDFRPYQEYIGSHIELMDVFTGHRKIIYSASNSLQAPSWTRDGKDLVYNSDGLLYQLNLANNEVSKINTGSATNINNDHVISFDGKQIAISNHIGDKQTSTLYILPLTGSDHPVQVTSPASGHSYLHSWSPDGKQLVFTGWRNNQFDIWTIDIATKKETQLTNTPTLDDSPEFTPDGKWIYFNSARTGTMKLWRMRPDGSQKEQITFDEYNDWFPHISPDGKWIVYLSYPKEISASDHPWYKKVYLRLMPVSGGAPKTIAYLYGGQGTINVPSWSPDSKKIAFVSNTQYPLP